jgi:hypothetical protein
MHSNLVFSIPYTGTCYWSRISVQSIIDIASKATQGATTVILVLTMALLIRIVFINGIQETCYKIQSQPGIEPARRDHFIFCYTIHSVCQLVCCRLFLRAHLPYSGFCPANTHYQFPGY